MKLENYVKQIAKGTIKMTLALNIKPDVNEIEYMVSKYILNMNCEHRELLAKFIEKEIKIASKQ